MSKQTRISLIIPNRNQGRLLPGLFRSIKEQSLGLEEVEVLFVDQGSTDNSRPLALASLQALSCQGWDMIETDGRQRHGAACNAGFSRAMGEYAMSLQPGVRLAPTFLEHGLQTLKDNPGLDGAYSSYVLQQPRLAHIRRLPRFDAARLRRRNVLGPAVLTRAEIFDAELHYCETCGYAEWDFWVRAAALGRSFARMTTPLAFLEGADPLAEDPWVDGVAKARIVCNTPGFFEPEVLRWALGLLRKEPWAQPFEVGVIPSAEEVGKLWKTHQGGDSAPLVSDENVERLRTILTGI